MFQRCVPLACTQISVLTAAVGLTTGNATIDAQIAKANLVLISPETQAVRFRDDGTDPTAAVGQPIAAGTTLEYMGTISAVKVIQQAATAKLNCAFYNIPGQ